MTDDELTMAYVDGELDALAAKRFEKRMAEAPELREVVSKHRALRDAVAGAFGPVAEAPVPDRLTGLLKSNLAELRPKRHDAARWRAAASMAACLIAGVAIGQFWQPQSADVSGERLIASATLARSLDQQLAGGQGSTRVLVSFRDRQGSYCRVFEASEISGIACHEKSGWSLQRAQANPGRPKGEYRQAGSGDPDLLAAAQDMMSGNPLDAAAERSARAGGWRQ